MEQQNTSLFDIIIWSGAAISLIGLLGILGCVVKVVRARSAKLPDDEMQAVLQSVLPLNLGALFLSIIGLMMVGVGIAFS
ncbi:MAG: hypothetical protein ACI9PY_001994 [Ascidiaceihabitans sp.]|jgi:hypothetical protein